MVEYKFNMIISAEEFIGLLERTSLGQRRPIRDVNRIATMLEHSNFILTAWEGELLIGVFRAVTDYAYCCYLSDLAVDADYQHQGIGKALFLKAKEKLGDRVNICLLAAPNSVSFYHHLGLKHVENCYVMQRSE